MNSVSGESLVILDIRGLIIRASAGATTEGGYTTPDGKPYPTWKASLTKFIHQGLLPILENTPPRRIIAVWDGGNDYRTRLFPEYKRSRKLRSESTDPRQKEESKALFSEAERFMAYLGVKNVRVRGEEADDVIALLCQKLSKYRRLLVKTVDADLLQLVSETVMVMYGDVLYQAGATHRFKADGTINTVPTELVRLYKAMVGDSSDGYRGVYGVGPAAWNNLVDSFGLDGLQQIEECVKKADWAPLEAAWKATNDKILAALLERWSEFSTAYQLASLHPEICYGEKNRKVLRPSWMVRVPSREKISWFLQSMGAMDLLSALDKHLPIQTLYTAENPDRLIEEMKTLVSAPRVAYDVESYDTLQHAPYQEAATNGRFVDVLSQRIAGTSWCHGANYQKVGYASFEHADTENLPRDWAKYVLGCITQVKEQVVQNANFELTVARKDLDLDLQPPYDTAIMSSYVDENLESRLKGLVEKWLHYQQQTYAEVTDGKSMNELSAAHVLSYGCDDSLVTAHLFDLFQLTMQLEGSWDFYRAEEILHVKDNVNSFIAGTKIDLGVLDEAHKEGLGTVKEATASIRQALQDNAMQKPQDRMTEDATRLYHLAWETAGIKHNELSDEKITQDYEALKKRDPETELYTDVSEMRQCLAQKKGLDLWAKAWRTAAYTPYSEERQPIEFAPTPTKLTSVLFALGTQHKIFKTSKTALNDFLFDAETEAADNPQLKTFCELLGKAAKNLTPKKRSGPAYASLEEFCSAVLAGAGGGPVVSHGDALNFGSPEQMQQMLYGKMSLPVRRRSKVTTGSFRDSHNLPGAAATGNKAALSALVEDVTEEADWRHPTLLSYMEVIQTQQAISLFYAKYPLWVSPVDGMIHPQIKNCGTMTRRPSGKAPNVLQASKKDDSRVRRAFVPWAEDYVYACLDFNGQELRLTASESKDPVMMDAYLGKEHKGPHTVTAGRIAEFLLPRMGFPELNRPITYEEYKTWSKGGDPKLAAALKEVRNKYAKQTNFTVTYVGGPTTLAESLIISKTLAEQIMDSILALYPRIQPWQREVIDFAKSHGYVETAYGNRKHVSDNIYSDDRKLSSRAERQAINSKAQSCAADILKIVLSEVARRNLWQKYKMRSLMPIYDELACCVPAAAVADYAMEMAEIMALTPPGHPIPMEAELEIGIESWGAKKEVALNHAAIQEFLAVNR